MSAGVRAKRLGLLSAVVLAVVGCSPGPTEPASPPAPKLSLPADGVFYLVAGESASAADLYRVRGDSPRIEQLTRFAPGPGVSRLTAGSGEVMMSAAPQLIDKIYRLVDDHLELLIDDRVFSPALSDDGRLAYTRLIQAEPRPDAPSIFAVVVRDLGTGEEENGLPVRVPPGRRILGARRGDRTHRAEQRLPGWALGRHRVGRTSKGDGTRPVPAWHLQLEPYRAGSAEQPARSSRPDGGVPARSLIR